MYKVSLLLLDYLIVNMYSGILPPPLLLVLLLAPYLSFWFFFQKSVADIVLPFMQYEKKFTKSLCFGFN